MGLPNMASTVLSFSQIITKRTITQTVVNHLPVKSPVDTPFVATVTTPKEKELVQVEVDTALSYKNFHSVETIKIDDMFIHRNIVYKVIKLQEREDYGFFGGLGEEVQ